jgi:hypothetical protein
MEYRMNKLSASLLALAIGASGAGAAFAHNGHDDEVPAKPLLQLELMKKGNRATIYVLNRGAKFPTAGATGTLSVTKSGAKTELALQPAGENAMETKSDAKVSGGAKAEATITFGDGSTASSKFVLK